VARSKRVVSTQLEVIRNVMTSAREHKTHLTLAELAVITYYPEASISAQLRRLKNQGHSITKTVREIREFSGGSHGIVWEYALD